MSPTLRDYTAHNKETSEVHICHQCDPEQYPAGKPIDPNDWSAQKNAKGEWVCGDCQIEELNKRRIRLFGPDHKDVKWFIDMENRQVKAYNNYAKRVNENMGAGLKYRKNKYTGRIPF